MSETIMSCNVIVSTKDLPQLGIGLVYFSTLIYLFP